jgi:hypothetical protein
MPPIVIVSLSNDPERSRGETLRDKLAVLRHAQDDKR